MRKFGGICVCDSACMAEYLLCNAEYLLCTENGEGGGGYGLLQLRSLLSRIFLSQHSHRTDALLCVSAVVSQFYLASKFDVCVD